MSLRGRVREWEDYHEQPTRRVGEDERPHHDDVRDDAREDLARRMARAQADGRSAIDSASSEVNDGQSAARLRESS